MNKKKSYALFILSIILITPGLFLRNSSGAVMGDYCQMPPFVSNMIPPNVLIILDNSNSMDEDFLGNAIGSYASNSKSVVGKKALIDIVNKYANRLRIGVATFSLPASSKFYLHNSPYFTSYDPKSYCPNPPADCVQYCQTGNSANQANCQSACASQNASFDATYFDEIIPAYAIGSEPRNRYCTLVYPKTGRVPNPTDPTNYIYYKQSLPFYDTSNDGNGFCYSTGYTPGDGPPWDFYQCYSIKTGTSDAFDASSGYSNNFLNGGFMPTDSDYAAGYADFGRRLSWWYVAQTWFANSSPGGGYLKVASNINNPPANTQLNALLTTLTTYENDAAGYMSCGNTGNPNACSYIVNAGLTPTAGTFMTANSYLKGTLNQGGVIASPLQYPCQVNFIVFVTDGMPSTDPTGNTNSAANLMTTTTPNNNGVTNQLDLLRCPSLNVSDPACKFTAPLTNTASPAYPFDIKSYVLGVGLSDTDKVNLDIMAQHGGTDVENNGHAFYADNATQLTTSLQNIFTNIISKVEAGTATSVLASGEGSGANLVQATFYPQKWFMNTNKIAWTGTMKNLWYYVDPFFSSSTLREDSTHDEILNISNDNIIRFRYDTVLQNTMADVCSDPTCTTITQTKSFESITGLWEAGQLLWKRDLSTSPRTIYTTTDGTSLINFQTGVAGLVSLLNVPSQNAANKLVQWVQGTDFNVCSNNTSTSCKTDTDCSSGGTCGPATFCSSTVNTSCTQDSNCPAGEHCISYRNRTAWIDINNNGTVDSGEMNVWKLGDIVDSTPKTASWIPMETYHTTYNDSSYGPVGGDPKLEDPADPTHFITTSGYKARGMVFSGGNDGMLHAFRLRTMQPTWNGQTSNQKARLLESVTGSVCSLDPYAPDSCGKEMWTFIPKNALPYLQYLADPTYCHVSTIDLAPYMFDASINGNSTDTRSVSSWRTVLIGGMRLGGACRNLSAPACTDCVKTPINNVGYSSYFALDITDNLVDPVNNPPVLLWEFSNDALGFSTTGPAIVRVAGGPTQTSPDFTNGSWYAVFGSGPTGPIDTTSNQFLGHSDQNLKLFAVGPLSSTPGLPPVKIIDTGIANAFAGSMINSMNDTNPVGTNYQVDVLYVPYVKKASDGTWSAGGVGRFLTNESNPTTWSSSNWSTVIDNIGPVTSAVDRLQNTTKGDLWLYFGSGRYYYKTSSSMDDTTINDPTKNRRVLYGIKDPCYKPQNTSPLPNPSGFISSCSLGSLTDVTSNYNVDPTTIASGWYINLDPNGDFTYPEGTPPQSITRNYGAERVITDTLGTLTGMVFFTTYKPYTNQCSLGGKTFLWAVKYNNGGNLGAVTGKALLQLSTGSIEQIDLSTITNPATPGSNGGRRSDAHEGQTSGGPPGLQSAPPPVKRVIHIRER